MNTQNMTPNEIGWGNYTADRAQWLNKTTLADIQTELLKLKKSRALLATH